MKIESNKHPIIESCWYKRLIEIQKEEQPNTKTKTGIGINFDFNKFAENLNLTNIIRRGFMYGISERIKPSKNIEK